MGIDFKLLLDGLLRSGLSQSQIAERVSCGQSTISDLLRGASGEPRFALGAKLIALAREQGVGVSGASSGIGAAACASAGQFHAAPASAAEGERHAA